MRGLVFCGLLMILVGCDDKSTTAGSSFYASSCKGIYFDRNKYGALRKFNEYANSAKTACLLDQVSLSTWEQSSEDRRGQSVNCTPQAFDGTLVANGNFYQYRDGREWLDLNGSTGQYRRVFLGELKDSSQAFTREQGCYYVRTGTGADAAFGKQLLLDTTNVAATEPFVPAEIFRVDQSGSVFLMTRFDDISDWGYTFCPDLRTPSNYCSDLRNGNLMYYPDLSSAIQTSLTNEAILIRTRFSFETAPRSQFDSLWNGLPGARKESASSNWRYAVSHIVDTPRFTDGAWRDYVMNVQANMPAVGSSNVPPVCYDSRKAVTLADGTTSYISGEVCYSNGQYAFTAH